MKRYFCKTEKRPVTLFWEITVPGPSITERFGTHGTRGENRSTICECDESARHRAQHKIDRKQVDGYREVTPAPTVGPWCHSMTADLFIPTSTALTEKEPSRLARKSRLMRRQPVTA